MGCFTTIETRIKPYCLNGIILSRIAGYGNDNLGYTLMLDKNTGVVLRVLGKEISLINNINILKIDEWNDISFTITNCEINLKINQVQVSKTSITDVFLAGNKLIIAKDFSGEIEFLKIYNGV